MRQVPQPTSAVHFGQFMHKCFVARLFVPGRKYCEKFTDQPKRKKNAREEIPQQWSKSEARPSTSPSASSPSPERSVDRGARTITRLENKIYLID